MNAVYKKNKYKKVEITMPEVRQAAKKVEQAIVPAKTIGSDAPIEVKRGPKPDILKDFASDPKALVMKGYISDGMSAREAGILAGFSEAQLDDLQKRSPSYRMFVQKSQLEFKQHHLKVIKDKADPKTSQWLLEKVFPEDFVKPQGGGGEGSSTTVVHAIFKSVQTTTDELVNKPVRVYEHEDATETEQDDNPPQNSGGAQPSLEPGGANIIG